MVSLLRPYPSVLDTCHNPTRRNIVHGLPLAQYSACYVTIQSHTKTLQQGLHIMTENNKKDILSMSRGVGELKRGVLLSDIAPSTAKVAIGFMGPFLSVFGFLFILRIVMSWYPKLPVSKFPYVLAYAPTEPFLIPTRKLIQPLGGVDVTPVVWFGLISFLNEILVGPQGLLVLLSQQQG